MIICYAQGMHLLSLASAEYKYDLHLGDIAKIWRGGCIIRSGFLNNIFNAYQKDAGLKHLLLDAEVAEIIKTAVPGARKVLTTTIGAGYCNPCLCIVIKLF